MQHLINLWEDENQMIAFLLPQSEQTLCSPYAYLKLRHLRPLFSFGNALLSRMVSLKSAVESNLDHAPEIPVRAKLLLLP